MGLGLAEGTTAVAKVCVRRAVTINRRTRLLSGITIRSTLNDGAVP